jgi:FAD:protein FMN transferase
MRPTEKCENRGSPAPPGSGLPPERLCKLPVFRPVAVMLLSELAKEEPDVAHLVKLLHSDPAFSAEILTMANSALYARQAHASSVQKAICILGLLSDASLALSSFTKSYIVGRSADAALASGASGVVVNVGGDLVIRGDWREPVRVADPKCGAENGTPVSHLMIRDKAVATSGNYRRGVDIGGQHYSHIIDPRSKRPVDHTISATVVASDPVDAGALATAFSILSHEEGRSLAASMPDVEYLLIKKNGEKIQSPGWTRFEETRIIVTAAYPPSNNFDPQAPQQPGSARPASPSDALWDPNFELTIGIELRPLQSERKFRPYVAIWVQDEHARPIRTIALWQTSEKPRYLPELIMWFADETRRGVSPGQGLASSITSGTRPPGKYTFKWDGTDASGKRVKAAAYLIFIETAHERAGHQTIHGGIQCEGVPQRVQLPSGIELASSYLDYHRIVS